MPWLGWTCGTCVHCLAGRENLCDTARFTGYQIDGGYADRAVADERYVFALPAGYSDIEAAPLLCAGLIGYRSLVKAGEARRLGLYGFGAAAHLLAEGRILACHRTDRRDDDLLGHGRPGSEHCRRGRDQAQSNLSHIYYSLLLRTVEWLHTPRYGRAGLPQRSADLGELHLDGAAGSLRGLGPHAVDQGLGGDDLTGVEGQGRHDQPPLRWTELARASVHVQLDGSQHPHLDQRLSHPRSAIASLPRATARRRGALANC